MKIIAHRANINGPSSKNENTTYQIEKCIKLGFDVEIDIRVIKGKFYLGHDKATQIIDKTIMHAGIVTESVKKINTVANPEKATIERPAKIRESLPSSLV